jgi:DNA repair protein RecN (Recombination protein N)
MLASLSIQNFVLIDRLDLEFAAGFSVLTGETGAGKSILLDAIGLVLGDRADAAMVRAGCDKAEISAEFSVSASVEGWLAEAEMGGDPGVCLVRRSLDANGRSRVWINGRAVTLAELKALGEQLIDIHGQHAHYALQKPAQQLALLDAALGLDRAAVQAAWRDWRAAEKCLAAAQAEADSRDSQIEQWRWIVEDLLSLQLAADAWEALQADHSRLSHAAELQSSAGAVAQGLDGFEGALLPQLAALRARLVEMTAYDAALEEWLTVLDGAGDALRETARELNRYAERVDIDPQELARLEARIADLNAAARRHKLRVEDLPAHLQNAQTQLQAAEGAGDLSRLQVEAEAAESRWRGEAERLSSARRAGAADFAATVTTAMQTLAMAGGSFAVEISEAAASAQGLDSVQFMLAPHSGQDLQSLAHTASGGELSRVGLALQTVVSGQSGAPTLIFDEVDAGIGGGVAEIVGRMLAGLGRQRQVLCVTHLPQVAACAARHWQVSKVLRDGHAVSQVVALEDAARLEEIARMLGGVEITAATRQHAQEMLGY